MTLHPPVRRAALVCGLAALAAACHDSPPPPGPGEHFDPAHSGAGGPMRLWSFEEAGLPADWEPAETNSEGTPARWETAAADGAPDGARVVRVVESENSGGTYNLLLTRDPFPADLELSVQLRADRGREDRGGGLVWRARDAAHYWIVRWNPLEENLRIYVVEDGVRRALASAQVEAQAQAWHEIRLVARGPDVIVWFDRVEALRASDPALAEGGRIGLWTKADAATSFDALRLAAAAPPGGPIPGPEPR